MKRPSKFQHLPLTQYSTYSNLRCAKVELFIWLPHSGRETIYGPRESSEKTVAFHAVGITLWIIIDVKATAKCKEKEKWAQDFYAKEFTLGTSKVCQEIYIKICNCRSLRTAQIYVKRWLANTGYGTLHRPNRNEIECRCWHEKIFAEIIVSKKKLTITRVRTDYMMWPLSMWTSKMYIRGSCNDYIHKRSFFFLKDIKNLTDHLQGP